LGILTKSQDAAKKRVSRAPPAVLTTLKRKIGYENTNVDKVARARMDVDE
jgi:hypothetical protein